MKTVKQIMPHVDVELVEALTRLYNIEYMRARNIAREQTMDQFVENMVTLERIIGTDSAEEVVCYGKFIDYRNGSLRAYFRLAREVAGRVNYDVSGKDTKNFYSFEALKAGLTQSEVGRVLDSSRLQMHHYKILHADHKQSQEYLSSLIDDGVVVVGEQEHWCRSKNYTGPRGRDILKRIKLQIVRMCDELGVETVDVDIDFSNHSLSVSQEGRNLLRYVREQVYDN